MDHRAGAGGWLITAALIVVACSAPADSPGPATGSPLASAPADESPDVTTAPETAEPDDGEAGPDVGEALGPDDLAYIGPMLVFEDAEPGPDEPSSVSAILELEDDSAVTETITQDGGSMSATGGDGTTYTLEIPSTALVTGVEITMTPIASFTAPDGSVWSDAVGVQLEPAGLHFLDVATLRIEPGDGADTEGWVAVASATGGLDAHLYPMLPDEDVPTLPITHFSGYTTGDGVELPSLVEDATPQSEQAQLQREIHDALEEGITDQRIQEIRDKWWSRIEGIIMRAASDCAYAESGAIARAISLTRILDATGFSEPSDVPTVQESVLAALENCIEELLERCFNPNLRAHVVRLLSLARMAQLMGAGQERYAEIIDILQDATPVSERCEVYGTITFSEVSWAKPSEEELRTSAEYITLHLNLRPEEGDFVDDGSTVSFHGTSRNMVFDDPDCPGPTTQIAQGGGALDSYEPTTGLSVYDDDTAMLFIGFIAPSHTGTVCGGPAPDVGGGTGGWAFDLTGACGESLTNGVVRGETIDFICEYTDVTDDFPGAEGIIIGVTARTLAGQLYFRRADD